jgi:hypothetical protein
MGENRMMGEKRSWRPRNNNNINLVDYIYIYIYIYTIIKQYPETTVINIWVALLENV